MSLRNLKSARTMHPLDSLFSPALLSRFLLTAAPAGLESVGDGEKSRTIMVVDDLLDERPYRHVRPPAEVFSRVRSAFINAEFGRMPTQRWHESDLLSVPLLSPDVLDATLKAHTAYSNEQARLYREAFAGPAAPYKRYMALSFVDDDLDAIPTGSPAVAAKLPAWEANARVVLAGAKRWAQQRWGRS